MAEGGRIIMNTFWLKVAGLAVVVVGAIVLVGVLRSGPEPEPKEPVKLLDEVWEDDENHPNDDIHAQRDSASGALVGPAFPISQATGRQADNGVAFDGTNYLIIWEDRRNDIDGDMECDIGEGTCIDIYGQLVSPSGTLVGPEIAISKASQNQLCPSLAFDGTNYLVVWQDYRNENGAETFGQFITKSGALSGSSFVISETPSPRYNPLGITFDGTNYLVVWNRDIGSGYPNPSIWDIYGRIVTPLAHGNRFCPSPRQRAANLPCRIFHRG